MHIQLTAGMADQTRAQSGTTVAAQRLQGQANQSDAALRQAAAEFEAIFLQHLLSSMRQAVPKGGLFEQSMARDIFEGMLDEELAKVSASAGGIGLADMLMAQLGAKAYNPR